MRLSRLSDKISGWIKGKAEQAGAKGAVFGLSGGVDSSVVAALCKRALGDDVLALIMSCHSSPQDEEYARQVAKKFDVRVRTVSLDEIYDKFIQVLPGGNKMAFANLKPRMRMIILYYFANNLNYLVVGTGNRTEITLGYFTKYGDGGADILPLGGLLKTEVVKLAEYLEVPRDIIDRTPSAGLWPGQTDEEEMGITYQELDQIIQFIEGRTKKKVSESKLEKVKTFIRTSQHKRESPPVFNNF